MIRYRQADTVQEVAQILDWAANEGWNPGLSDAAAFLAADPEGFFLADRDGEPVAAISVVNHSEAMAFLGLYLCRPECRGQGIGYGLWQQALAHAGERTVGLDGVAAQQANYARSGFVRSGATRRFEGALEPRPDAAIARARPEDLARLQALDTTAGGYARPRFLTAWLEGAPDRITVCSETGFATARLCREGAKIGPVIAPTPAEALALARAALAELPPVKAIIDLPDSATGFEALLRAEGFVETFATARMYRGTSPKPLPMLQAIATMELG
ncbi:GNAT family N-acetyltransferase [Salipiger sp. 1_MG-2023]|uniref:GNAT family N-acetyltransferase n=1 Tax=Salipiger sp. 1_MG-2023 TaxID=3062665 RepID=UPI0026E2C243|nr:GNAT family N-acetyltransferase [Salipiger sp. 1_MG-2023]MDO6588460.1 GNAT family N-acetyltransferase [Salipiger sp. 1_MG-2023]